jgi:hypothetical protein
MRRIYQIVLVAALMATIVSGAAWGAALSAKLTRIKGDVQVRSSENGAWTAAKEGATAAAGAQVKCGPDAEVFIGWGKGHVVRVGALSNITIDDLSMDAAGKETNKLTLNSGKAFARVRKLNAGSAFIIKTPTAVAAVRGTGFEVAETSVSVVEGTVSVEAGGETIDVDPGMFVDIPEAGEPPMEPQAIPPETLSELQQSLDVTNEVGAGMETTGESEIKKDAGDDKDAAVEKSDDALDDAINADIVDSANGDTYEPGTGAIEITVEY